MHIYFSSVSLGLLYIFVIIILVLIFVFSVLAERLPGKSISENDLFCVEWDVKP